MLKIQEPGSSAAVWAKNSTVLLPPQSVLSTKEQKELSVAPARVGVSSKKEDEALNHGLMYLCKQKRCFAFNSSSWTEVMPGFQVISLALD